MKSNKMLALRILVSEPGTYKVKFGGARGAEKHGDWQLLINGANQGPVIRQNGEEGYADWELGEKDFPEPGYGEFKFLCVDAQQASSKAAFDYIELIKQ